MTGRKVRVTIEGLRGPDGPPSAMDVDAVSTALRTILDDLDATNCNGQPWRDGAVTEHESYGYAVTLAVLS